MTPEDVKRLNYIYYTSFTHFVKQPHSIFYCYVMFFVALLHSVLFRRSLKKPSAPVLVYATTVNNIRAVQTILDNLKSEYVLWGHSNKNFPLSRIYLKSAMHLGLFQKFYSSSTKEEKSLIRTFYTSFMTTYGYYKVMGEILDKYPQIKVILFSNDHSTANRCMIELAEKRKIKTVYVQHASVTEKFPPLHFSFSFLDGMDSYNKYCKIGDLRGNVVLSGSPRFDIVAQYVNTPKKYDVGIALNLADNIELVFELCKYIQEHYSRNIVVRPHPRMDLDFSLFEKNGFVISNPVEESSFSFLSKIKVLVANESSIHLDAALTETPSLLYNFSENEIMDWYSFLKNKLMPKCENQEEVVSYLQQPHVINKDAVRFYVASYKMPWDGKVGLLVASLIDSITSNTDSIWVMKNVDKIINNNEIIRQ